MDFYHYTSPQNVEKMLYGQEEGMTGLVPRAGLMPLTLVKPYGLPEKATKPVIFGLLSSLDPAWCRPVLGQKEPLLEMVIRSIQTHGEDEISLLQLSLTPEDDAYVANYAARLNPSRNDDGLSMMGKIKQSMQDYWNSAISLESYATSNVTHMMPEVICFDTIPVSRIRVVEVFKRDLLINIIRAKGNFPALPPRSQPVPERPGVKLEHPDPKKPPRGSHLHLV